MTGDRGRSGDAFAGDRTASEVARLFDDAAPRFDLAHDVLAGGQTFRWRRLVREAVAAPPGALVLDVFAGTGASSAPFARSGVRTVALDFSLGMLTEAARQYRRYGTVPEETRQAATGSTPGAALRTMRHRVAVTLRGTEPWDGPDPDDDPDVDPMARARAGRGKRGNLTFVAGNATALPFPDECFDAVTMSFGLRNVPDPSAVLSECARVTRPGGRIVVCEYSRPTNWVLAAAYRRYLHRVLPRVAARISSHPPAYEFLVQTVRTWPEQRQFARMLRDAGWERVEWRNLSGGIVAIHRACRPGAGSPGTLPVPTPADVVGHRYDGRSAWG